MSIGRHADRRDARDTVQAFVMHADAGATSASSPSVEALTVALGAVQVTLETTQQRVVELEKERDVLRASHERLRLELELWRRRLYVAKAERVDTTQLELEFAQKLRELETLAATTGMAHQDKAANGDGAQQPKDKRKGQPKGRRDVRELPLEQQRVELTDPVFEQLITAGKAARAGFEESSKLAWQRGGMRCLVIARAKYRAVGADGEDKVEATPMAPELLTRPLAAPSLLAHIAVDKYCDGLPLFRIADRFARDGVPIDRGTMSRWMEEIGATLGSAIVEAMRAEALRTAFCIATDATGVAVQPVRAGRNKARQPCRRGHFFVQIADRDHVFFEYTPKETSAAVGKMFEGFTGYVQADAKSVYDALFTPREPQGEQSEHAERAPPREVGCWAHARRKLWEATVAKDAVAREGLARIGRIYALDASWRAQPHEKIARMRELHLRPHVNAFFDWADTEFIKVREQRGLLRDALGYAVRQKSALVRFLEDGRLPMDNNRSERALRTIAVGRKAWLFCGSDDHAQSAANLFTLIASARLHRLDPEQYLRDMIRVVPFWPTDRYIELAPKYWSSTRERLFPEEIDAEVGPLCVPPPAASPHAQLETADVAA